jgi:hypothetical protein
VNFRFESESWTFCLPKEVDYGVVVEGNVGARRAGLHPLRLIMAAAAEPDYSKEDREHQAQPWAVKSSSADIYLNVLDNSYDRMYL